MKTVAYIGTAGGLHVTNYHIDANTQNVPAPIQAGRAYGPVSFATSAPPQATTVGRLALQPIGAGYSRMMMGS